MMFGNQALTRMTHDEDIVAEAEALAGVSVPTGSVNTVASASAETPPKKPRFEGTCHSYEELGAG